MCIKDRYISVCPAGIFAVDENKKILNKILFDKQNREQEFLDSMKENISKKEQQLIKQLKGEVIFEIQKHNYKSQYPNKAGEYLRENLREILLNEKVIKTKDEFVSFMNGFNKKITKEKIKEKTGIDKIIVQVVGAIEETDKIINTMQMRLKEWYLWYFPEIFEIYKNNDVITDYVAEKTFRAPIKEINIEDSAGMDLSKKDLSVLKEYAKTIKSLIEERKNLEKYLEDIIKENMPNLYELAGAELTSHLISASGSLQKLAQFPSSTIQILGAEKALFMFLKGKGKSPKHGVIFLSPYIQQAPKDSKGKIARTLASKLSIAAKLDYYKGEFKGKELKKSLDNLLRSELSKKHNKESKRKRRR